MLLQSEVTPFIDNYTSVFPNFTDSPYQVEAALSQYFLNNLLYEVHSNGPIVIDSGDLLANALTVGWAY